MLKPGTRLFSAVCSAEMITVKAPAGPIDVTIGGLPPVMSAGERTGGGPTAGNDAGCSIGKRYVNHSETVELLCTRAGDGGPAVDGTPMQIKDANGQVWDITLAPPPRTSGAGLTEEIIPVGAEVTVSGHRNSDPNRYEIKTERVTYNGHNYDVYANRL